MSATSSTKTLALARQAEAPDRALFEARRAFNAGFLRLEQQLKALYRPGAEEIWQGFNEHLGAAFALQSEGVWGCALHPGQRAHVARLFCDVAGAKMQLDPGGDPLRDASETRLWSAAFLSSPRAVRDWETEHLAINGELGFGFTSVKHRLADLFRRAERFDNRAIRLYIEVFTGRYAAPTSRFGVGAHHSVAVLLERGAALSPTSSDADVAARYSLCLLLASRSWSAPWVVQSLRIAREKSPVTSRSWAVRRTEVEASWLKKAQKPAVENLIGILQFMAQFRLEKELQIQSEASILLTPEVEEKPRRKRGRPRKIVPAPVETSVDTLPDATPQTPSESSNQPELFLDFDALFGSVEPTSAPSNKTNLPVSPNTPKTMNNEWLDFDFAFDKDK